MANTTHISPEKKRAKLWMNIGRGVLWTFISICVLAYGIAIGVRYFYDGIFTQLDIMTGAVIVVITFVLVLLLIKRPFWALLLGALFFTSFAYTILDDAIRRHNTSYYIQFLIVITGVALMAGGAIGAYRYKRLKN